MKKENHTKEAYPVYCIIAAPRQGKSRLLDEVAERFYAISERKPDREKEIVVSITFNSASPLTDKDVKLISCDPSLATAHFWGRVVQSLLWTTDRVKYASFHSIMEQSWFPLVDRRWADEVARKIGHTGTTWIVIADELSKLLDAISAVATPNVSSSIDAATAKTASKVVLSSITTICDVGVLVASGFQQKFKEEFASLSGRPAVSVKLVPTIFKNRSEFKEMFTAVEEEYKKRGVPFAWMTLELLKYSPGLVGLWLEMLKNPVKATVTTLSDLLPPIVNTLSHADMINKFFVAVDNQLRHCATAELGETWTLTKDREAESLGIVLDAEDNVKLNNYFLNPFFLFHDALQYDFPGKKHIVTSLTIWEKAKLDHMILEEWRKTSHWEMKAKPHRSRYDNAKQDYQRLLKEQPSVNLMDAGTSLNKAKGNVAEEIVASALAVRLVHTPPTTLADLIKRIGGAVVYRLPGEPSLPDDSRHAVANGEFLSSKENAFVKLIAFPSMEGQFYSSGVAEGATTARHSCQEIFKFNVKAINRICGASVLRMASESNAGCDLGVIVNTERTDENGGVVREKALFLYEVRHYAPMKKNQASHTDHPLEVVRKARLALNGLLDVSHCDSESKENYLQQCNITRVVFVYCIMNTSVRCNEECVKKLEKLADSFNEENESRHAGKQSHRCDVSIHVVDDRDNDRLWKELLMNTFYYIFPDPEIDITKGARSARSKKSNY